MSEVRQLRGHGLSDPRNAFVVYKYALELRAGSQPTLMAPEARIVACQPQRGVLTLWAMVPQYAQLGPRWFEVIGTGFIVDDGQARAYVGTCPVDGYVWHVFEIEPPAQAEGATGGEVS